MLTVFRELSRLPGASEVFDARHNPVWVLPPSSDGARALLEFFQQIDSETGAPIFTFPGGDTRFLGDLYQNLSEAVRKRYALLQTPEFVEKFILEETLAPAIDEFGLAEVRLIDPTCGSGHFLLGAFRDLMAAWQKHEAGTPVEDLARRSLDQLYGIDINPYAVAIARFRLVLAVLEAVGVTRLDRAPALRPHVVVADSLLHRRRGEQMRLSQHLPEDRWNEWGDALFRLTDSDAAARVLEQRYHAVVGNPPYITEKDGTKRRAFIRLYDSASGQYALAAPFTERFFDMAAPGGFVGMINANSFTKRDFGRPLISKVLPRYDVQLIVDTSGCYIPGHGTPTLLLFGRDREPSPGPAMAILGKRGESRQPSDPARAPVWLEIMGCRGKPGFEGTYVSVETVDRDALSRHPWVLVGGGARTFLAHLEAKSASTLSEVVADIGFSVILGEDDAFIRPSWAIHGLPATPFVVGDGVRDWQLTEHLSVLRPFGWENLEVAASDELQRHLWAWRRRLEERIVSGSTSMKASGRSWFDLRRLSRAKHKTPLCLSFAFVATHNHFAMSKEHRLFNRSAPIVKLTSDATVDDHLTLLGYLNSSTVAFWCRLVMFPKGGDQVGDGARLSATQWNRHLEYAGNLLRQLPPFRTLTGCARNCWNSHKRRTLLFKSWLALPSIR